MGDGARKLSPQPPGELTEPFATFDQTFADRIAETDAFYAEVIDPKLSPDAANVVPGLRRPALDQAGLRL